MMNKREQNAAGGAYRNRMHTADASIQTEQVSALRVGDKSREAQAGYKEVGRNYLRQEDHGPETVFMPLEL